MKNSIKYDAFSAFIPIAQTIEQLLHPFAEVVIHNLKTNKIVVIYNNFSKRTVGDDSLIEAGVDFNEQFDTFGPYEKLNWNGNRLKSISTVLRNEVGTAIGLLCINLDVSKFDECQNLLNLFINKQNLISQPQVLFKDDWQERVNHYIHNYLQQHHLSLPALTKTNRYELIKLLWNEGAFKGKNAASYVADILGISRATVYKWIAKIQVVNEDIKNATIPV